MVMSGNHADAIASRFPSGLKSVLEPPSIAISDVSSPVAMSKTRTAPHGHAAASRDPSGLNDGPSA